MKKYSFQAVLWRYKGKGSWYFVTLPKSLAKTIRKTHGISEEGWGRLKAIAKSGAVSWDTAIWFDTKAQSYLLPVKAIVRKNIGATAGSKLKVTLCIQEEKWGFGQIGE